MKRASVTLLVGALLLAALGGVALAKVERGTPENDTIVGTRNADRLVGRGGNDRIEGRRGDDELYGGEDNDEAFGARGEDLLDGASGTDVLLGGPGADRMRGGGGGDYLFDGRQVHTGGSRTEASRDELHGEAGDDFLYARNEPAAKDVVHCGPGRDTAVTDRADRVADNCEDVSRG
jgi:Ca2+-binding RTX toxin-like protein